MLKIYDLKAARRYLRQLQLSTQKRATVLSAHGTKADVKQTGDALGSLSKHIRSAQLDQENITQVLTALDGPLCELENTYMVRLKRVAVVLKTRIEDQVAFIDQQLSELTTRYDSKLTVLLGDLQKRLSKGYGVTFLVRRVQERDVGVLCLKKESRFAFCVILTEPMDVDATHTIQKIGLNYFKVFFHNIPPDMSFDNFHPFESPSRVVSQIADLLREEGF